MCVRLVANDGWVFPHGACVRLVVDLAPLTSSTVVFGADLNTQGASWRHCRFEGYPCY